VSSVHLSGPTDATAVPLTIKKIGPQRIALKLDVNDIDAPGTLRVTVVNPESGGGTPAPLAIPVDADDVEAEPNPNPTSQTAALASRQWVLMERLRKAFTASGGGERQSRALQIGSRTHPDESAPSTARAVTRSTSWGHWFEPSTAHRKALHKGFCCCSIRRLRCGCGKD
jgi:hypothetical protein